MKRTIVMTLVSCLGTVVLAEPQQASSAPPDRKRALLERIELAKGGPLVEKAGSRQGTIVIVNAQKRAKREWLDEVCAYLVRETKFDVRVQDGTFDLTAPKVVGQASVFVVDSPSLPRALVASEDRWAMVNVAKLDNGKEPFFAARTKKQTSRTFAMLCGGMTSGYDISLAGPMPCVEDLDVIPNEAIPFDVALRLKQYMAKFGVSPRIVKPYVVACKEGWAPMPTNDVQKIIWEKCKAEANAKPSNPIKIVKEKK